jgi:outer membrane receptor protein involved in Fe transport
MGRHQVRTGLDVVRHELNHIVAASSSFGGQRGGFQFGGLVTSTFGYIPQVWNEMAGFVLGLPSLRQKGVQEIPLTAREWQYGFYVNDHWNATDKLTLNLGLRLERYPLMKRADSGIERLDFATYEVVLGGRGNVPEDVGISVKKFYLAPRLGAAYRLTNDTVLRGGYGRTFNPLAWARPLRGSYPYDIVFSQTAEQFSSFPIQSGIPPVPIPDLSSGRVKLPPNTFMRSPDPGDVDRATIQQMNVAVEQRLPGDLSLEIAYVHTRTDGGYADINRNFSEPGAGQPGRKLFAVAGTTDVWEWGARTRSRYHGLQMALNRPFKNGLLLKGAYTLSRAQNDTDEDGWAQLMYSHPLVRDKNFALAGYDRTHVLQMGFVYELPFAKGSRSLLGQIVKNWQINGIGSAYSGVPFSVNGTNTALNCPGCGMGAFILINVNGDPKATGTPGSATEPWYDKANFSQPTGLGRDGFGTSRRNQFRTPPVWNVDLGLFRSFPMGRFRPELRIEAQNVFNHTNWGRPDITFSSPTFMTFTPAAAHQQVTAITATGTRERTIQVGLRLEF